MSSRQKRHDLVSLLVIILLQIFVPPPPRVHCDPVNNVADNQGQVTKEGLIMTTVGRLHHIPSSQPARLVATITAITAKTVTHAAR